MGPAELTYTGEGGALSEDRRKAIVELLQDREVLQARIRESERFIEVERER